jgi:hypothetical protein
VIAIDALERPIGGDLQFQGESFAASFRPYELRAFRVRVG